MTREENAEVLVAGAGPVGMTAALLLAEHGVKATVIDAAEGTAAHSYACALHPHSLELLDHFGLLREILEWGRRINTLAFYEGTSRRTEVKFSKLSVKHPFVIVLPQNALEWLLERTLNRRAGIHVRWRHRLTNLSNHRDQMVATVEQTTGPAPESAAASQMPQVTRTYQAYTPILIGADGHNSVVRRRLGIHSERLGSPELFAVFEFETNAQADDTVRVVLDDATTSVLWPISNTRCRWSFQLLRSPPDAAFPEKERTSASDPRPLDNPLAEQELRRLIGERAPWFERKLGRLSWVGRVPFERRLAERFSDGRCWLLGDAAHQTSPVGVQSLNVGLSEAKELVGALEDNYRDLPGMNARMAWDLQRREEWRQLLGLRGAPQSDGNTDEWVRRRAGRIVPCLPAAGTGLAGLLQQLQLTFSQ